MVVFIEVELIAEDDESSERNQPCKIILLRIRQCPETDAVDFCADVVVEIKAVCCVCEKILVFRVPKESFIGVGEFFQWRPGDVRKVRREVLKLVVLWSGFKYSVTWCKARICIGWLHILCGFVLL